MTANLLSEYLKQNTKQFHDDVEAKFQSQKIFDKSYTLNDYRQIIWFNYLFHLNYENKAFAAISEETASAINLDSRRKIHLLEIDLKSLDMETSEANEEISVKNEAEALGILYVMEGSSLGGNVIKKQLSQNHEFIDMDFHFFGCYGEKTGEFWKNFKEVLDNKFSASHYNEVLTGVQKAYDFLKNL
ncbi:biliverdin-producing heme oxygenase [Moheibacter sediminis]|uniref:Heme oxygenase n=1 Tax=Moheibacter sediminis TaxID=1434700 RepID=A0A1W1Z5I6_9FLAO|nr:biliverdin-producing heme oxygenase [Moheibacter sediminis]SMC43381.1 heme oxygenase [Moheibacter sediminis]